MSFNERWEQAFILGHGQDAPQYRVNIKNNNNYNDTDL
jgi:hypothetical protein